MSHHINDTSETFGRLVDVDVDVNVGYQGGEAQGQAMGSKQWLGEAHRTVVYQVISTLRKQLKRVWYVQ